jgi:hypothetical protein
VEHDGGGTTRTAALLGADARAAAREVGAGAAGSEVWERMGRDDRGADAGD